MSSTAAPAPTAAAAPTKTVAWAMLAQFKDPEALLQAVRQVRAAGYTRYDCHSSYPIHGLSEAMHLKPSLVPLTSFVCAVGAGLGVAAFEYYTAVIEYPIVIGGKPLFSFPAFFPIIACAVILTAAFVALAAAVVYGKPALHHPLFNSASFAKASDDALLIGIEVADPKYDQAATRRLLESLGGTHVEVVYDVA